VTSREPPPESSRPLWDETQALLDALNRLDIDALREIRLDDAELIDVDPRGGPVVVRGREEWDEYMERNLGAIEGIGGVLWTEVLDYEGHVHGRLAYSALRFIQVAELPDATIKSTCVATIIWSWRGGRWREARRHQSLERSERLDAEGRRAA
jgi:hypothetical protein